MKPNFIRYSFIVLALMSATVGNLFAQAFSVNSFSATYSKTNVSICGCGKDGTITVTATGGFQPYTYSWSGSTGYTAGNSPAVYNLPIGYYSVVITDAVMNKVTLSDIHIEHAFLVNVTNDGTVSGYCNNSGTIVLHCNAGISPYTYSLDGAIFQCSNTFEGLAPGSYTAYVKDLAGCTSTKAITVGRADPLIAAPIGKPSSTCKADGSIEFYHTGGVPPYAYSINGHDYQACNTFQGLAAATYTCYIRDSKGCMNSRQVAVGSLAPLAAVAYNTSSSTCTNNGTMQVGVSGGAAPYSYSLNGGSFQTTSSFTGLASGNYTITVKDQKGCLANANSTISLTPILVTAYPSNASSCTSNNGKIQLFRTGGFGPYLYSLNGNNYQASNVFSNLPAGTYTGFVKDSKNCIGLQPNIFVGPVGCNLVTTKIASNEKENKSKAQETNPLKITVYPNPSSTSFSLSLDGFNSKQKITIIITDLPGKKIYQTERTGTQLMDFGTDLKRGVYILQVTQGMNKRSIKLVKE